MKTVRFVLLLTAFLAVAQARGGTEMATAAEIIDKMGLQPLPGEGGYYRETYKSRDATKPLGIACDTNLSRSMSTAIYYMVTPEGFSALHRLTSDEIFHFYAGDPVEMIQIFEDGTVKRFLIGSNILEGETPQVVVPKGVWQATRLRGGGRWALMGTTVAPGFEFEDFELGDRDKMYKLFPQLRSEIDQFTRE